MQKLDQKLDSREVAEMVGKEHKELLRDIRRYCEQLGESNIALTDFFTESTYRTSQNKEMPCYLVTKKGCEFIAHKLTGIKGTEFTAKYINRFHEMEEVIAAANLSPELQMFQSIFNAVVKNEIESKKALEQSQHALERVESIREVVSLDTTSWRDDTRDIISKIANSQGGGQAFKEVRAESYELLEKRMGVNLKQRLTNKRRRMAEEGVCKSKRDKLSYVDIIAEDKKLIEGYTAIVKEMAIKYGVA